MDYQDEADFRHVTGDLDKIVIGNDIMPLRDSDHQKDIRGMDIAFLMEAAEERRLARELSNGTGSTDFTNAIVLQQVQDLASKISAVADCSDLSATQAVWYEGQPAEITAHALLTSYPLWLHQYPDESGLSIKNITPLTQVSSALESQPIQEMFGSVDSMKELMRKRFNAYQYKPYTSDLWVHLSVGNADNERFANTIKTDYLESSKPSHARVITGTGSDQAYWTLDKTEPTPDYIPDIPECQDDNGDWAGREVYGQFFTGEQYSNTIGTGWSKNYLWILKVSDQDGKVTSSSLNAAISRIKASGASQWNFDPPTSICTAWNAMYFCYIQFNMFFMFDTMGEHTTWELPQPEPGGE